MFTIYKKDSFLLWVLTLLTIITLFFMLAAPISANTGEPDPCAGLLTCEEDGGYGGEAQTPTPPPTWPQPCGGGPLCPDPNPAPPPTS